MVTLAIVLLAGAAEAQPAAPKNAYQVVVALSHDLGVAPQQFVSCFRGAKDAIAKTQPGPEREQARNTVMLPCLQKANPSITAEALAAVIERYRPPAAPVSGG
jgi:hypothetical protein